MKAVWVIEVRDTKGAEWKFYEATDSRASARHLQEQFARRDYAHSRVVKFVREASNAR